MPYSINSAELSELFAVPARVADKLIKLSGAIQLKVLLVALRLNPADINAKNIADKLSISEPDVVDALNYWVDFGILTNAEITIAEEAPKAVEPKKKTAKIEVLKPSREEVIKRGEESPEITFMLREAQFKFGRALRQNEASTLLWLHDDEGFSVPIILLLISFAVSESKANIGFIERTAISWINSGVATVEDAEKQIALHHAKKSAWGKLSSAMGIEKRMPSTKESEYAYKWIEEYGYSSEMLKLAYDACIDSANKFSMPYISKIIENWHKNDVKTVADIEKIEANKKNTSAQNASKTDSFDLESYQKALETLPE